MKYKEKFIDAIMSWEETMDGEIRDAIDNQEQRNREVYYWGVEKTAKYAKEMLRKHLELNKIKLPNK